MPEGIVLKGVGGFYSVRLADGEIVECRLRGRLRLEGDRVIPGDRVVVSCEGEEAVVENVLPRKNQLVRPLVANIDQVIVVQAAKNPPASSFVIDRLLALAEHAHLDAAIIFNKVDLGLDEQVNELVETYRSIGYPVLLVSVKIGVGLDQLKGILAGRISTLAGPSGVGKSSLINSVVPEARLETGEVSKKLKRGRHTTRHVELLPLLRHELPSDGAEEAKDGGLLADTPGFTQLRLPEMSRAELSRCFREFAAKAHECQFSGCLHWHEPGCAVKAAVAQGIFAPSRLENYQTLLQELIEYEETRY